MPSINTSAQLLRYHPPYYDYDGLTGAWLWLPWWLHCLLAVIMWPLCVWIIPTLNIEPRWLSFFLAQYVPLFWPYLSLLFLCSALASIWKSRRVQRVRQQRERRIEHLLDNIEVQPTSPRKRRNKKADNPKPSAVEIDQPKDKPNKPHQHNTDDLIPSTPPNTATPPPEVAPVKRRRRSKAEMALATTQATPVTETKPKRPRKPRSPKNQNQNQLDLPLQ